ncbi:MAG TPA: type VI secretion system accessory protein TagJ [Vicinamibacterales bacterium]|nr:type VI secretion system accessory protein TagJ [Vicinamibacterales bacterium]
MLADAAEFSLKSGDPGAALAQLQEQVRARPDDAKLRIFLFQLLCVVGKWDRALNQLNVAAGLDPAALAMAQTYGDAVRCEAVRTGVFEGRTSPMIFGQPDQWLALLIESLLVAGRGEPARSQELRARAFDEAPATAGTIDNRPFTWIADADSRIGPVLEAVINGRYYWIPFSRLLKIDIEKPEDLRDMVWMPAHLQFENGGESVAFIPTRYPGSEASDDGLIVLARKTVWEETAPDTFRGLGQRVITTDVDDIPLMDVRSIVLTPGDDAEAPPDADANG